MPLRLPVKIKRPQNWNDTNFGQGSSSRIVRPCPNLTAGYYNVQFKTHSSFLYFFDEIRFEDRLALFEKKKHEHWSLKPVLVRVNAKRKGQFRPVREYGPHPDYGKGQHGARRSPASNPFGKQSRCPANLIFKFSYICNFGWIPSNLFEATIQSDSKICGDHLDAEKQKRYRTARCSGKN